MTASVPPNLNAHYLEMCVEWQNSALQYVKHNVGYVPGTLIHFWHGKKKTRNYWGRWDVLVENKFDPDCDLKRDTQGIFQLTDRNYELRDGIRAYFRARSEDSIDL
jgi:hypothetical protein